MLNSHTASAQGEEENISPALGTSELNSNHLNLYDSNLIAYFNENGNILEVRKLPKGYIGDPYINDLKKKANEMSL